MIEKLVCQMEVTGEAEDMARLGFAYKDSWEQMQGIPGYHSCRVKDCQFRAKVILSTRKRMNSLAEEVQGGMDGNEYIPTHWRETEVLGTCVKQISEIEGN